MRTEITDQLKPHAARWTRGASLTVPADLALTASGLRLWAIASGRAEEAGYLLGTAGAGRARAVAPAATAPPRCTGLVAANWPRSACRPPTSG